MTKQISMIELFGGIGAQEKALRQLGIPYNVIHYCDCDANATLSYAAMRWDLEKEIENFNFPSQEQMITELQAKNLGYDFQKKKHSITSRTPINKLKQYYIADKLSRNLGDISKVEKLPYANLVTYSFPCTDVSVAGKGEGMANKCEACGYSWPIDFSGAEKTLICPECGATVESSTRSGLLGQVQRLLAKAYKENELPDMLLMENVKNLTGRKFIGQFETWIAWLDSIGYNTYWKVLNAKHYGVPQNRERIFAISIRKDIDTKGFIFPETIPLTTRLKDILEHDVDEKYYLPDDRIEKILNSTFMQEKKRIQTTDVCDTLLARDYKDPKCVPVEDLEPVRLGGLYDDENSRHQAGAIWDKDAISPTLDTMQGGNRQPFIIDEIKVVGNYMPSNHDASRVVDIDGIAPTVKENHGTVTAIAEPQLSLEPNTCLIQPKDRDYKKKNLPREVHIESKDDGVSHALRTNGETMVIEPQIIKAGQLDCSFDQSGRVYDPEGIAPTIMSNSHGKTSGGYTSPKVIVEELEPFIVASRGRNPENPSDRTTGAPTEQRLEPNFSGCTNCLTSVGKDNYVCEPQVLRAERTEYGKAIRKQYEAGEVDEKIGNMREMKPRTDGVANTITTLLKDNYVAEPIVYDDYNSRISADQDAINTLTCNCGASAERNGVKIIEPMIVEDFYQSREPRVYTETAPTIRSERVGLKAADGEIEYPCSTRGKQVASAIRASIYKQGSRNLEENVVNGLGYEGVIEQEEPKIRWRIRKLTDKECWRLMNFTDEDNDRASEFCSASALYKQAGNSICVCCLIALMSSLFIEDGYKADVWTKYMLHFDD